MDKRGFTLIELLVVVAIIAVLSTLTFAWISSARAKSRDTQAIREIHEVQTALSLYLAAHGSYPNRTPIGGDPWTDNFNSMASQLVAEGDLTKLPVAPGNHLYQYYNYGPGPIGALLITKMETYPPSARYSGTCRPLPANAPYWCTADLNTYYCLCTSY